MTTTTAAAKTYQVYQVFIRATPEAIRHAITDPSFTEQYFYGARIHTTPERRLVGSPDDPSLTGEDPVFEYDPPRRLVHGWRSKWNAEMAAEEPSRVTWEIEPREDGTCLLTLVHDRLERAPKTAEGVAGPGWMFVLSGLKTLLETGRPLT
jgi:uncharacterized protein YndB with AHSA1/START domain